MGESGLGDLELTRVNLVTELIEKRKGVKSTEEERQRELQFFF